MRLEFNNQAQHPVGKSTGSMVHRLSGTVPPLFTANPHHQQHLYLPSSPRKQRGPLKFETATTEVRPSLQLNTSTLTRHPHHNTTVDGAQPRLRPDSQPRL
ncbi:hypothetical protein E2C01_102741 [Portunus trituberculatus]|uniref:Uncharacterized protein n=1 Tax=Portunus trituberculatus TaxID=210409 RepID=A0A5B7KJ92_PORTR|nr:hypothetical protein [Portunus trituberculatus]